MLVRRRQPGACIDDEEHHVGFRDGRLGLLAHAAGERRVARLLKAGGVDQPEAQRAEFRISLAPVAGDARQIMNERLAAPDQAIEKRRFPDIRPADDGDGERQCSAF
jgi:hypothetical protein